MSEHLREILKKAEIKRVGEKITKKELCNIFGLNYNFYMNCVSGVASYPSQTMADELFKYMQMPTQEVYSRVFAQRSAETDFHKGLKMEGIQVRDTFQYLHQGGFVHISKEEERKIIESTILNEFREEWESTFGEHYDSRKKDLESQINDAKEKLGSTFITKDEEEAKELRVQLNVLHEQLMDLEEDKELRLKLFIKGHLS